jgi:hypothetical protein
LEFADLGWFCREQQAKGIGVALMFVSQAYDMEIDIVWGHFGHLGPCFGQICETQVRLKVEQLGQVDSFRGISNLACNDLRINIPIAKPMMLHSSWLHLLTMSTIIS